MQISTPSSSGIHKLGEGSSFSLGLLGEEKHQDLPIAENQGVVHYGPAFGVCLGSVKGGQALWQTVLCTAVNSKHP